MSLHNRETGTRVSANSIDELPASSRKKIEQATNIPSDGSNKRIEQGRSPTELPTLDNTKQLTDAVERLGPLLESFKAEQKSQEKTIQRLLNENKILKTHATPVNLGHTSVPATEFVNKIASLEKQVVETENLLKEEREAQEQTFNRLSHENNMLKAEMMRKQNQRNTSATTAETLNETFTLKKLLEEKNDALLNIEAAFNKQVDAENDLRIKLDVLEKERNTFKRNMDIYKNGHEEERQKVAKHLAEIRDLKEQREEYQKRYAKLQQDKTKIENELLESKKRLSRLMGNKLSDHNPDIADLSDMNRPTKIAEKYSELYDNQWTDAFEAVVETTDEITGINILLSLLQDIRDFCGSSAETQSKKLAAVVLMTNCENKQPSPDLNKQLKDFRRANAIAATDNVFEVYMAKQQNIDAASYQMINNAHVKLFVRACLELCWLMSVQDPPVVLGKRKANLLDTFDTAVYRPYTQTGAYFDYLVWPPLYLHENGPLLAKGVAQPKTFLTRNTQVHARPGSAVLLGNVLYDQVPSTQAQSMERSYRTTSQTHTADFSRTVIGSSGIYDNAFPSTMQAMPSTQPQLSANATPTAADHRRISNNATMQHEAMDSDSNPPRISNPPTRPEDASFFDNL